MNIHDATELAYKNGYEKGLADGKREVIKELADEITSHSTSEGSDNVYFGVGYWSAINKVLLALVKLKRKYGGGE